LRFSPFNLLYLFYHYFMTSPGSIKERWSRMSNILKIAAAVQYINSRIDTVVVEVVAIGALRAYAAVNILGPLQFNKVAVILLYNGQYCGIMHPLSCHNQYCDNAAVILLRLILWDNAAVILLGPLL
jgi:hypothetical protein